MDMISHGHNPLNDPGASIGLPAPDFAAEAFEDGGFLHLDSAACRGAWLVLLFYPRDFDDQAAAQLAIFAEFQEEFEMRGARVIAASSDSAQTHRSWVETTPELAAVRFPMLGNGDDRMVRALSLLEPGSAVPFRAVVLIDPAGFVQSVRIGEFSTLEPEEVLDDLDVLNASALVGRNHS